MRARLFPIFAAIGVLSLTSVVSYAGSPRNAGHNYGLATFYDPGYGRNGLTAAHRTLAFGTMVRVLNRSNGRSVVVRIADRGPQAWTGRVLDLSRSAARVLGMMRAGVVPVEYAVLR
jgi:rare lipoprotein A